MKYLVASDIHGSSYYAKKLIEAFKKEGADKLVLLGDLLYHGPRNDLPRDYDTKSTMKLLNEIKEDLVCVRGNCDSEVDQMVLEFPIMADYALISLGKRTVFVTHGHLYSEDAPPLLKKGDVLLNGHTHVVKCKEYESFVYMNPGSVSLPKENTQSGYIILSEEGASFKTLEDMKEFDRYEF